MESTNNFPSSNETTNAQATAQIERPAVAGLPPRRQGALGKAYDSTLNFVDNTISEVSESTATTLRVARKSLGAVETALDEMSIDLKESYIVRRQEAINLFISMGYTPEQAVVLLGAREA